MTNTKKNSIVNGTGKNSYPLSSYTYAIVKKQWSDYAQARSVMTFLYLIVISWLLIICIVASFFFFN